MRHPERRTFMTGIAAFPLALAGQTPEPNGSVNRVPAGQDRFSEHHTIDSSTTELKVGTRDTRGDLFIMENTHTRKGGPPRDLHRNQDEWSYVI